MRTAWSDFDPEAFISELVTVSLKAAEESRQAYAALAQAEGHATEGIVEITVAPQGTVRSLVLTDEPSSRPAAVISADLMRAYRRAAAEANANLAAVGDPAIAGLIRDSVPDDVAAQRAEEPESDRVPQSDAGSVTIPARPTIDDLPPDPELDELMAILDDPDPFRAAERLRSAIPRINLDRPASEIDAEIRAEIQSISDRAESLGPDLAAIRAEAENADGRVEVDAWGKLTEVELSVTIRTKTAQDLETSITRLIAQATHRATQAAGDLLRGSGLTSTDDPTLTTLTTTP